ncbi:MAG: LuxR C-terminal-related transcriptional regulator [Dysgonamonadaceae bacterium]|jgi:DNA-binding CsgD family transcriptional regulator|nr:LuxR C-terminal-related transcriptional regulator [Dysgonamonadaceae bacterium]
MTKEQDFFIEENRVSGINCDSYESIHHIIEDLEAFTRLTYKSVYVIDYHKQNFLFVSNNPLFLCGFTAEKVKEMGYSFYINQVVPEDLSLLLEINKAGFKFLSDIPREEKRNYTVSYDFRIMIKDSAITRLINHQITPLRLTEKGEVWLALCVVSISTKLVSGNITMFKNGSDDHWLYNKNNGKWEKALRPELTEKEKEVLKFSSMGYNMKEIAVMLHRSFDSVRLYRKNIFLKLNVDSIAAAVNYAKNHRLI